jgi:hypothetical protein
MRKSMLVLFLFWSCVYSQAQITTFNINGLISDAISGESLPGAHVYIQGTKTGVVTNNYGFYVLALPSGDYTLKISYVGYTTLELPVQLHKPERLDIKLSPSIELNEIEVKARSSQLQNPQMGVLHIPMIQAASIPALMGEKDVLKAFQLMPGVQRGKEGTGGLFVRGGGSDQNLIILDDAVVYNANHLFGFFSLFNGQAIKEVTLIKGGFPARYGGRLSSVIDITMKEGDMSEYHGEAGIGLIASRIMFEGPIKAGKSSFMIAGRRTYFDLLTRPFLSENEQPAYFFYDLNLKTNFILNEKNRLYFSAFLGKDELNTRSSERDIINKMGLNWRNILANIRLNTLLSNGLFMNNTLVFSQYNSGYYLNQEDNHINKSYHIEHSNGLKDISLKSDFVLGAVPRHTIRFGSSLSYYQFMPRKIVLKNEFTNEYDNESERSQSGLLSFYIEDEFVYDKWMYNIGLRQNFYTSGKHWLVRAEPRITIGYLIGNKSSIKASFTMMNQFIHLMSSTGTMLPADIWLPATKSIQAQQSIQYSIGYEREFSRLKADFSLEAYYKTSSNVLTYRDGANFFFIDATNPPQQINWEANVTSGKAKAFGFEAMLHKKQGKWNGWLGYGWSKSSVRFNEINSGDWFPSDYDRRHDISIVLSYDFKPNRKVSASWTYMSGHPVTLPYHTSVAHKPYDFEGHTSPTSFINIDYYGGRNNYRTDNYHRLDLALQITRPLKHGERTWEIGIYNAYNHHNPFMYYVDNLYGTDKRILKKMILFPFIPSITYVRKF